MLFRSPPAVRAIHVRPAEASAAGYQEHVSGAGHASLLGVRYADTIVAGILHVLREAG